MLKVFSGMMKKGGILKQGQGRQFVIALFKNQSKKI